MSAAEAQSRVALSVDVEDWVEVRTLVMSKAGGDWTRELERNLPTLSHARFTETVERTLAVLGDAGARGTFFIVGSLAERWPDVVKRISAAGHEIGCHGYYHRCKFDPRSGRMLCTPEEFRTLTTRSRAVLEDLCGRAVRGYRAPGAYVNAVMLDILDELGFAYDSSVTSNSLYRKSENVTREVESRPYRPRPGAVRPGGADGRLIEFPWPYVTRLGLRLPTAGGPLLRFFGSGYIISGLRESLERGHACFYFHTIDIARHRMPAPGRARPFFFNTNGARTERDVRRVLASFAGRLSPFEDLLPPSRTPAGRRET